jgi:hypothetical protein
MSERRAGRAIAIAGAALAAAATLVPIPGGWGSTPTLCIACGEFGGVDLLLNIALFVPFGVGLGVAGVRLPRALVASFLFTLAIELLQLRVVTGRDASVGDLLANFVGGMTGTLIGLRWRSLVRPSARGAPRLAVAGAIAWLAILAATAWLLQPSVPYLRLWAQWAPRPRQFAPFEGRLLALTVNGVPLPPAREVERLEEIRDALTGGDTRVEATVVPGAPTPQLAAIARVSNPLVEALLVGQDGSSFMFRQRFRAADYRLRWPMIELEGALSPTDGEAVHLAGGVRRGTLFAERAGRDGVRRATVPVSPALGWTLLLPFNHGLGGNHRLLSALWLGTLLLPAAYWGATAESSRTGESSSALRRNVVWRLLPWVVLAVGLIVVPAAWGLPPAHWSEWAAGATALLLGPICRRAASRTARSASG